ncbi:lytic transglycosylase domain-containing protein [Alicyclobacillus fructus]|uniref:lytic transglycosylase domain-containing protein n=1 Tax=Alicyclobacillus fructus TaxID=2816082 RepID=UPI001A8E15C0|nr:lytic transglycosylase domain-containing protein [Alicyclobacillus fructus]
MFNGDLVVWPVSSTGVSYASAPSPESGSAPDARQSFADALALYAEALAATPSSALSAQPQESVAAGGAPDAALWPAWIAWDSADPSEGTEGQTFRLDEIVRQAAAKYGVPEGLLEAVIQQESGGNPNATSPAGAIGLMQLMPATAAAYGARQPYDPAENVDAGAHYLADLLARYQGNVALALAAYNAGPEAVDAYGGVPPYPETQAYVRAVLDKAGL